MEVAGSKMTQAILSWFVEEKTTWRQGSLSVGLEEGGLGSLNSGLRYRLVPNFPLLTLHVALAGLTLWRLERAVLEVLHYSKPLLGAEARKHQCYWVVL